MILLTHQPIDVPAVMAHVQTGSAGAVDIFIGTVRNQTQQKRVVRLEYEAYEPMALKKMQELVDEVRRRWPVEQVAIVHRVGVLDIGEAAVVIAVSTPHRAEAFEACRWLIDTLKEVVPIWKKEVFEDGEVWVAAHA
ncbi:MAG: molybdenum cofactor biosynthesis protein MoaE [Cytophagaceae bacterium]|nr:molybdenum cofactor biosynthesis protein MoaE [Cytophagaceae bacterium]